jgi:hypothetical protein
MLTVQTTCEDADLEANVNADIQKFDDFFQSLGNQPLVPFERAIIKTYLHYKIKGEKRDGSEASR